MCRDLAASLLVNACYWREVRSLSDQVTKLVSEYYPARLDKPMLSRLLHYTILYYTTHKGMGENFFSFFFVSFFGTRQQELTNQCVVLVWRTKRDRVDSDAIGGVKIRTLL